jgi:hypothetical protein
MRAALVILILASLAGTATAQTGRAPPKKTVGAPNGKDVNDALSTCLAMWDASTHMSRREWARACRRVADRIQNLTVK